MFTSASSVSSGFDSCRAYSESGDCTGRSACTFPNHLTAPEARVILEHSRCLVCGVPKWREATYSRIPLPERRERKRRSGSGGQRPWPLGLPAGSASRSSSSADCRRSGSPTFGAWGRNRPLDGPGEVLARGRDDVLLDHQAAEVVRARTVARLGKLSGKTRETASVRSCVSMWSWALVLPPAHEACRRPDVLALRDDEPVRDSAGAARPGSRGMTSPGPRRELVQERHRHEHEGELCLVGRPVLGRAPQPRGGEQHRQQQEQDAKGAERVHLGLPPRER
jgi:hypothetical protein